MPAATAPRFASVDILRGLTVAAMLLVNNAGDWGHVFPWLEHAAWHGCQPADYIFPLFLFVAGASLSLALEPQLARGAEPAALRRAVLLRALRLVGVGLLLHLAAALLIPERAFRLAGVLQRIGLCLAVAGPAALYLRPRGQWLLFAALLAGYSLLLFFGGTAQADNWNVRVDSALLGRYAYQFDPASGRAFDPEGVLSTLGAIASTVLGLRAGSWLRAGAVAAGGSRIASPLLYAGVAAAAAGLALSFWQPFNKALWTPGYVLWTGGAGLLLLALLHRLVDLRGLWLPGRALGLNAILAYAGSWLMVCLLAAFGADTWLYQHAFASWITPLAGPRAASAAWACAVVAVWWGVAVWLHRRRWYWKV
ncbi:heparan-alpha-glucosaminide N-acetyltransferase domain-containing protein [Tahibacter harae]|uniref:Heparan-alpha-glucosaminide N-acetyltransferase domain-containing protein n=1 Tax=Tahibacter harae TaxID=2963937 RepID=A0ABT1QSY7_9GAMM|nr:heparan-alpha-glucosaminide N-acetyltransferase domain-containing protein [Tahibacter harae]MCQ4165408.1 heparan-alpha-glucosaminide N-acetyltransferase domain-containing protein [Tahibacter harae]